MNQLCKVCGEPAAGFHFGAFTCEGCKSFFGRTYNNIAAISGCKNNGDCVINKKNRTACKACRLRKCLLVGMSKSGSRYGRRSNWFKIHCLLQEQQSHNQQQHHHQQQQNQQSPGSNSSPINTSFEQQFNFTHHQLQAKQTYQDKTNPSIKTANLQNNSSSAVLVNPFLPVQQLINNNNNNNNNKSKSTNQCTESKSSEHSSNRHNGDCSSPSDSGASSADPEEENFWKKTDCTESFNDSNRSSSEPLKLFPINGNNLPQSQYQQQHQQQHRNPFVTAFQHMQIPSLLPIINRNSIIDIQDEPIDLSIKSIPQKRCRTTSPSITIKLELTTTTATIKPAPLDLTLVRSQPMSG